MKIVFLTYGGGNLKYYNAVNRLVKEMKNFYNFDKIVTYTDLELQKTEYYTKHKDFIKSNRRGNGYWIWKAYYVYNELQKLDDDDILLYLDCGFEINEKGIERFLWYIEETKNKGNLFFYLEDKHTDKKWNKMDTIKKIQVDENLLEEPQVISGAFFIKKNKENMLLFKEWYDICQDYQMINDMPSIEKNFYEFIEHRHDQSVLSLLVKKYNMNRIFDETWPDTMKDKDSPLRAMRKYN
jgi:hypothetical protein